MTNEENGIKIETYTLNQQETVELLGIHNEGRRLVKFDTRKPLKARGGKQLNKIKTCVKR